MTRPTIAAVVLVYNQAQWVREALASLAAQEHPPDQIIVIDDASTDGSQEAVDRAVEEFSLNAELIRHERNRGVSATLNHAFATVETDLVATLPADDKWLPRRLAAHVEAFAGALCDVFAFYSDAVVVDAEGRRTAGSFLAAHRPGPQPSREGMLAAIAQGNFLPAPASTLRMSAFKGLGGFDEGLAYEDWDFWLRLASRGGVVFHDELLAEYRVLPTSHNRTMGLSKQVADLEIMQKWWGVLPAVDEAFRARVVHSTQALVLADHPDAARWARLLPRYVRGPRARIVSLVGTRPFLRKVCAKAIQRTF